MTSSAFRLITRVFFSASPALRPVLLAALAAASLFEAASAQAQDMAFSMGDTGQIAVSAEQIADGPPSEVMVTALQAYQQKQYDTAALSFFAVAEGQTPDAEAKKHQARFFLGKSLFHLGFYQAALVMFDEITRAGPGHLFYDDTLPWLAQLATELPEPANIVARVGRYGMPALQQFDTPKAAKVYGLLLYLLGRYHYAAGEFDRALEALNTVPTDSEHFVPAQFYAGMTNIRLRRSQPAIAAFRKVTTEVGDSALEGEDKERFENLAWLSLGRMYYSAANQGSARENGQLRARLIGNAVTAWNQVSQSSEYWLDALFEASWAFFLTDEYSRALGNVHSLYSPFFANAYYPEALVIKAVTFFANCQAANARATVARFHELYDPVQSELNGVLAQYPDNLSFFEFLKQVRAGKDSLTPRVRPVVKTALTSRTVLRNVEYVNLLAKEERLYNKASPALQNSALGGRILQEVAVARQFAIDQAGDLAKGRYSRILAELRDLMNQVDTIELELTTYERGQLSERAKAQQAAAAKSTGGNVVVDEEHQVWPFDGEYWRDELGFYRQQVTNKCTR